MVTMFSKEESLDFMDWIWKSDKLSICEPLFCFLMRIHFVNGFATCGESQDLNPKHARIVAHTLLDPVSIVQDFNNALYASGTCKE